MNKSQTYRFNVDGIPKGQPRIRISRHSGHVYTPDTADSWKERVIAESVKVRPDVPFNGPVVLDITCFMPRPKRLMRKKDPDESLPHISKPDFDNLEKATADALTEAGWFLDDCQVYKSSLTKMYHSKSGRPCAFITVTGSYK